MAIKTSKIIKSISVLKGIPYKHIAKELGILEESFNNKLSRGNYKVTDLVEICEALGVDVGIKDGDNFYSFIENKKK